MLKEGHISVGLCGAGRTTAPNMLLIGVSKLPKGRILMGAPMLRWGSLCIAAVLVAGCVSSDAPTASSPPNTNTTETVPTSGTPETVAWVPRPPALELDGWLPRGEEILVLFTVRSTDPYNVTSADVSATVFHGKSLRVLRPIIADVEGRPGVWAPAPVSVSVSPSEGFQFFLAYNVTGEPGPYVWHGQILSGRGFVFDEVFPSPALAVGEWVKGEYLEARVVRHESITYDCGERWRPRYVPGHNVTFETRIPETGADVLFGGPENATSTATVRWNWQGPKCGASSRPAAGPEITEDSMVLNIEVRIPAAEGGYYSHHFAYSWKREPAPESLP